MPCIEIKVALNFANVIWKKKRHKTALGEFCKQGLIQRTWESLEGKKNKLALMSFNFVFKVVNFDTFGISLH